MTETAIDNGSQSLKNRVGRYVFLHLMGEATSFIWFGCALFLLLTLVSVLNGDYSKAWTFAAFELLEISGLAGVSLYRKLYPERAAAIREIADRRFGRTETEKLG